MSWTYDPKREDRERMVVAHTSKGDTRVLHGKGPAIEWDIHELGFSESDFGMDALPKGFPEKGIVVFECLPRALTGGNYESGPEFDGYDYHNAATWREPTAEEATLIVKGDWEALDILWDDVPSMKQFEAAQNAANGLPSRKDTLPLDPEVSPS